MRKLTLLSLALLVAVLAYLARERAQSAESGGGLYVFDRAMFPDLDPRQIASVRIDHLERAEQLRLERDGVGAWYLTDPLAYPAEPAVVARILDDVRRLRGLHVPAPVLAELGLDPPRVVLELVELHGEGRREHRLEIGSFDADGKRVFVRIPGHPAAAELAGPDSTDAAALVLRVPRTIDTLLDRGLDDFRDRRVTSIPFESVVRLERGGRAAGGPDGLELVAELEGGRWFQTAGPRVALDPDAIGILVRGATDLRVARFVDDAPAPGSALDDPELWIELTTSTGQSTRIALGHEGARSREEAYWLAERRDAGQVWHVSWGDVELFFQANRFLYDYRLVRAFRDHVRRLELVEGERTVVLARAEAKGDETWTVALGAGGAEYPASTGAVEDALSVVEAAELGDYLPGTVFVPADPPLALHLTLRDGTRFGGRVGARHRDPETGAEGYHFLRDGDELVALVGDELRALCSRPLDELRRRKLHSIEILVERLRIEHGGEALRYRRDDEQLWYPEESRLELPADSDFFPVLERYANLRVEEWLAPADAAAPGLAPAFTVVLSGAFGPGGKPEEKRLLVGRAADGTVTVELADGGRARLLDADLAMLQRLFGGS